MISYDGSDFTTASLNKKSSPVRQDLVQSTGKVVKSIFVPNVGWASQVIASHPILYNRQRNCFCDENTESVVASVADERRGVGAVQRRVSAGGSGRSFLHHLHVSGWEDHQVPNVLCHVIGLCV